MEDMLRLEEVGDIHKALATGDHLLGDDEEYKVMAEKQHAGATGHAAITAAVLSTGAGAAA